MRGVTQKCPVNPPSKRRVGTFFCAHACFVGIRVGTKACPPYGYYGYNKADAL